MTKKVESNSTKNPLDTEKKLTASDNGAILAKPDQTQIEPKLEKPQKKLGLFSKLQKRQREHLAQEKIKEKEIDKELKKIYLDSEGKMPNMSKLEFKNNRVRNFILGIIIFLSVILVVSFLGFMVFLPKPKFTGEKVNLEIKAPFSAISGQKINYQIKLENLEDVSLTKTQLAINFPAGFIYETSNLPAQIQINNDNSSPAQLPSPKTWQINDLFSQQSKILDINGYLIGPLNSKQTIVATLSYYPANFNSEFQKNISFDTNLNDSLLTLGANYQNQVANNDEVEIDLQLANNSTDQELNNLELDLNYPPEFTLTESQIIEPDSKNLPAVTKAGKNESSPKTWQFDKLLPQAPKQIKIKGKFNVNESTKLELVAQLKLKGQGLDYFIQRESKLDFDIIKGDLLTNIIINGSNQNQAVNLGDTLNYLLDIQNKSKKALGDIKIRAVLDSVFLDWQSLVDNNNGVIDQEQILWTKDQIPKLAFLLPEDEVQINLQINLKKADKKYADKDYQVKSFFEAQINKVDNADSQVIIQSPTLINPINTDLNLNVIGRYFDDKSNTIGSGPLPPIVGQKTTYKIFWTLTNSLHEINNIEIKAKLPDYVHFENNQNISTGTLFENQQNEVVWQISSIPTSINQATASFDISITPKNEDVGKILTLLPEITAIATDSQTQGKITISIPGITTNLDNDPLGKGKGLILAE